MDTQQKVQVWVHFKDSNEEDPLFLLLKTHAGRGEFWQPITGSVDPGESLPSAALREAVEETGLTFSSAAVLIPYSFEFEGRGRKVQETGFSLEYRSRDRVSGVPTIRLDPREHAEYRWVSSEQALKMLGYPSNAQMLKSFLAQTKR